MFGVWGLGFGVWGLGFGVWFRNWGLPCQTGIGGIYCEGDGGWVEKGQEGEMGKREGGVERRVDAAAAAAAAAKRLLPNLRITNQPPPPPPIITTKSCTDRQRKTCDV